jgi:hypothetical protein
MLAPSSWRRLVFLAGVVLGIEHSHSAAAQSAPAADVAHAARYPLDPVCPWGRLADGHGVLVRCLERAEAQSLMSPAAPAAAPPGAAPAALLEPARPAPGSAELNAQAASGRNPGVAAQTPAPPRDTRIYRKVSVKEVGPAVADTGDLPEAQVQLRKAQERYAQCISNNGGLEGAAGKVTLRFLVRERGRAEGVSVKERQGVSLAAAKCIAEVVDRRYVGYPAAPIVGATLSIEFVPEGAGR